MPPVKTCRKGKACGRTCIKRRKQDGTATRCTKPPSPYVVNYADQQADDTARDQLPPEGSHVIKVNINIMTGVPVTTADCNEVVSNITCGDLTGYVMPLVNDIFNIAGVFFDVVTCDLVEADKPDWEVPGDYPQIEDLFRKKPLNVRGEINIYIVPTIGFSVLGFQNDTANGSYIVLSETHPSDCQRINRTRLGNTLAHEIGHDLGLALHRHHSNPNNLMHATDEGGEELVPSQIRTIQQVARRKFPMRTRNTTKIKRPVKDLGKVTRHVDYEK